ncbi:tetratricopeptide repeat protein [Catellatospora citrea]|uniref:Tetratricopeptide repeat protein n=1 Tax=Catellatospora citrea TaxID=53366 RepID=A0A8J3P4A9_9ACTN|nr:tetratricopeptide repeat protein [Catellatospora citrea]RKE10679.1 tetratricopeptide repeat protein [Catellatospora citrea]GIG03182.1 hypothetical protein Cci01nite_82750 [Catellatospora citrea]
MDPVDFRRSQRTEIVQLLRTGRMAYALTLGEAFVGNLQELFPFLDQDTLRYLAVAEAAAEQGAFDEALACLRIGLERHRSSGPAPRGMLELSRKIAVILVAAGRAHEGLALLQEIATLSEFELGPSDLQHGLIINSLGTALRHTGDLRSAYRYFRQAAETFEATMGVDSDHFATALLNLSDLSSAVGRPSAGIPAARRAKAIWQRTPPASRLTLVAAEANLGRLLYEVEESAEAAQCFERAADMLAAELGDDHPEVVIHRLNQAIAAADAAEH